VVGVGFDESTWMMAEIQKAAKTCRLAACNVLVTIREFFIVLVKMMKYLDLGMDSC
jgi:hypothetical protein